MDAPGGGPHIGEQTEQTEPAADVQPAAAPATDAAPEPVPASALSFSRRALTLGSSGVLVVLLVAIAALLPVPYVELSPGQLANTIGSIDGEDLITIEGRETYPTAGHLDLTTVRVAGGPGRRLDLATALWGWLDPKVAVVPEEQVFPAGETEEEVQERNSLDMTNSQADATVAALRHLDIVVPEVVTIQEVVDGGASDGVLETGDVIIEVDGAPVADAEALRDSISARTPGDPVRLSIEREGDRSEVTVATRAADDDPGRAVIGVAPTTTYDFPFDVEFGLEDVGGPSAGLMFTLGIIDKLTPGEINGGDYVAGTGTIAPDGAVGAIGGIQQKLIAARDAGADLFLAPAGNCDAVRAATPDGLRVARVESLDDAIAALEALTSGELDSLTPC